MSVDQKGFRRNDVEPTLVLSFSDIESNYSNPSVLWLTVLSTLSHVILEANYGHIKYKETLSDSGKTRKAMQYIYVTLAGRAVFSQLLFCLIDRVYRTHQRQ